MKVLFFAEWYPNRNNEMLGLFVRNHVEAVSLYNDVRVLYIQADSTITKFEIVEKQFKNHKETTLYFPFSENGFFAKIKKQFNYFVAYYKGWKLIVESDFKPEIIHTNILTRNAFMAYIIKLSTGIPYVITEHWSRYLEGRKAYNNCFDEWITKKVVKASSAVFPVSDVLKKGMLKNGLKNKNYKTINNVVNDVFFEEQPPITHSKKQILHISCFDEHSKNISGILRALAKLSEKRNDFELTVIGTGPDFEKIVELSKALKIKKETISFVGEKEQLEVARTFQNSDVFVLFSNYETAAVVIAESLVCGVPIISTKVGIATEVINQSNGKLIDIGDENALLEAMNFTLDNLHLFNKESIKTEFKNKFSYQSIGNLITQEYEKILNR